MIMKIFLRAGVCVLLVSTTGCSTVPETWKKSMPWSSESRLKTSKFETPSHMIAIWTPDVMTQPNVPPTRGFGGRLYFYNEKNQAVPVEGQLMVYGYDDGANPDRPGEPQKKFAFTPEQFTQHYSESNLGASYSIWLPWDEAGGEQQRVSLVPVFTATSGKIVMGQQAINLLPGRVAQQAKPEGPKSLLAQSAAALAAGPEGVQQVSHQQVQIAPDGTAMQVAMPIKEKLRMRTSTIELTPNLRKRMALAPEASPSFPIAPAPQPAGAIPAGLPSPLPTGALPGATPPALPGGLPVAASPSAGGLPAAPGWDPQAIRFAPTIPPAPASPVGLLSPDARGTTPSLAGRPLGSPASLPPRPGLPASADPRFVR